MRFLVAALACLIAASGVHAQDYVYRSGFYWLNGNAYNRTLISTPGSYYYGRNGCVYQYPSVSSYSYTPVPTPSVTNNITVNPPATPKYTPDWKIDVLKYKTAKDDQDAFLAALRALGINGQDPPAQGGATAAVTSQFYTGGNSLYGYTYNSMKEAYGQLDVNALYQAAARLAQGAQQYGSEATSNHAALVQQAGDNQARIAEITAQASASALKLKALEPLPSTKTVTTITGTSSQPVIPQGVTTAVANVNAPQDMKGFVARISDTNSCGACHTGANPKGGLDISKWETFTPARRWAIIGRLVTEDPNKRMPRLADGTPGALSKNDLLDFMTHTTSDSN